MANPYLPLLNKTFKDPNARRIAFAIIQAESGWNPRAYNGVGQDRSYGLGQINMLGAMGPARRRQFGLRSNDDLYDPANNLKAIYAISKGGTDWSPWTTYTSGKYKQYLKGYPGGAAPAEIPLLGRAQPPRTRNIFADAIRTGEWQLGRSTLADTARLIRSARESPLIAPPTSPLVDKRARFKLKAGGGWGGSYAIANSLASIAKANGLGVMSEKRNRKATASGGVSDHWTGSKNSYAFDLSNGDRPTEEMDKTARELLAGFGKKWDGRSPIVSNFTRNGYRIQILYRTNVGGNHYNHIHVGVKKL